MTAALVYCPHSAGPDTPWSLGVGFDDFLIHLPAAESTPVDAADKALGEAGYTRTGPWLPHPTRGSAGWMVTEVTG